MTKFIKKFFLLTFFVAACCGSIAVFATVAIGCQYGYNYQASLVDKVARLESIDEPKIILVGNSNVAFGFDSRKIEDAFGMPVVNLGLHGGLGNAFHEEIAKLNINSGDIVVVCHCSFADTDEIEDRSLAWITIENNAELRKILRGKDYPAMITAYPNYVRNATFLWLTHKGNKNIGGTYSRGAFNEYGDIVYKPEHEQMDEDVLFSRAEIGVPEINDICVKRLNEYNKYITDCGASMVIAGYPIAYGNYASFGEDEFISFKNKLQEVLECDIISDYTDYFYPYNYFYDASLHLTTEGAEARTEQLISDLSNWMLE